MSDPAPSQSSGADFAAKIDQAYSGGGYQRQAYEYVFLSIRRTIKERTEKARRSGETSVSRHINAETLVNGLLERLHCDFGYLANDVMRNWGVFSSADIGEVVFRLADVKLLSLSADDSRSDFCGICDFSANGRSSEEVKRQKKQPLPCLDRLLNNDLNV